MAVEFRFVSWCEVIYRTSSAAAALPAPQRAPFKTNRDIPPSPAFSLPRPKQGGGFGAVVRPHAHRLHGPSQETEAAGFAGLRLAGRRRRGPLQRYCARMPLGIECRVQDAGGGRELTADGHTNATSPPKRVGLLFDFGSHVFGRSPNHEKNSSAFESRCDEMLSEAEAAAQLKIKRALARHQDWH